MVLARVRWANVAKLAAVLGLVALVVAWPRLREAPPAVPVGREVPVAGLPRASRVQAPPRVRSAPRGRRVARPRRVRRARRGHVVGRPKPQQLWSGQPRRRVEPAPAPAPPR